MREKLTLVFLMLLLIMSGCTRSGIEISSWPVMGTIASVQVREKQDMKDVEAAAKHSFSHIEKLLNRFDPSSELSTLKSLNDDEVIKKASLSVRKCYEAAFLVSRLSGGAFDPRWRGKETLDLGAIAKGFALDEAALFYAKKASENSGDVLIDLGGNLISVKGSWKTGVKSPNGKGFASFFSLSSGEAVATSASYYRGAHIRDARTGNVVSNGVLSVTVISKSAMWADALSTVLFILGPNEGMEFLKKLNTSKEYPFRGNDETAVLWIMESGSFVKVDEKGRFKVSN
jgi:thiamine biosynthesis lipoprotein